MNRQQLESKIKRASDIMRADDNAKLVTKYMEHLSWLLFLKVHEAIEQQHGLVDPSYAPIISREYRWSQWTTKDWKADELISFINSRLFPHLRSLTGSPAASLIGRVFSGVTTVLKSGYSLLEVIDEGFRSNKVPRFETYPLDDVVKVTDLIRAAQAIRDVGSEDAASITLLLELAQRLASENEPNDGSATSTSAEEVTASGGE